MACDWLRSLGLPLTRTLVVAALCLPTAASAQQSIAWASFPVEREVFTSTEADPRRYSDVGTFDGIGMLYFSPSRRIIEIKGLKDISIPYLGQEPNDKYEFHHETFSLESIIRVSDGEYAFQGTNGGQFERTITGKIRVIVTPVGVSGRVNEFLMEEHGQAIKGVMNRYRLAQSLAAHAMLKTYDEVFLGGNWVALELQD